MPRKRRSEDVEVHPFASVPSTQLLRVDDVNEVDDVDDDGLQPTLDRFAEDTSMLGFRYLHTRYKNWFRILWALVLVFFIGLTLYQVGERVTYYFIRNPLTTRRTYETLPTMYFPTIGVCNKMQLKASSVAARDAELLKALCNVHQIDGTVTTNETKLEILNNFDSADLLDIYRRGYQSAEDLFVSCEFGKSGSCQDDIRPLYTPNGICFAVSPNKTILRPGPEAMLSLVLNLEVHEIIPGMVAEPGVILSIYDAQRSLSHFSEGIHLEAGKVVTIPVNEVRKLQRYEGNCGTSRMESFSEKDYSKAACEWTQSVQHIEKQCHCRPLRNPAFRTFMTNAIPSPANSNATAPWRKSKRRLPICTLRQELQCVQDKMLTRAHVEVDETICPEDCEDISFSSIVFGGKLVHSEILSALPSDWEEHKEKRLAEYQKALDVIPNDRIPVVRNVQQLATELQTFVIDALKIFEMGANGTTSGSEVACLALNGRSFVSFLNQMHAHEPIWERVTTYLQRSLARELNTTTACIGITLNADGSFGNKSQDKPAVNTSLASLALLQLGEIENSLRTSHFSYGLKMMHESTRQTVVKMALPLLREMRDCVMKMYDNGDRVDEIAEDCRLIFRERYSPFLDAYFVYSNLDTSLPSFVNYIENIKKTTSRLQTLKTRVKMIQWQAYNIDLKEFESLYREGAKDHAEIEEMLKLRKLIVTDIAEAIKPLAHQLQLVIEARERFLAKAKMENDVNWAAPLEKSIACFDEMLTQLPTLKKSRFIRGEWLSRLRNQVLVAQSYSATPQYDEVNLLHIKFYFAHFKQETIAQELSYNMFLLLAEIGGTIGLYVGATLLTVAETFVFFFERRTRNFLLKKGNYV